MNNNREIVTGSLFNCFGNIHSFLCRKKKAFTGGATGINTFNAK